MFSHSLCADDRGQLATLICKIAFEWIFSFPIRATAAFAPDASLGKASEVQVTGCGCRAVLWPHVEDATISKLLLDCFKGEDTYFVALGDDRAIGSSSRPGPWYMGIDGEVGERLEELGRAYIRFAALDVSNDDNFYFRHADGRQEWQGPPSLSDALEGEPQEARVVSFAPHDGWCGPLLLPYACA